jgi:hypothetical protein
MRRYWPAVATLSLVFGVSLEQPAYSADALALCAPGQPFVYPNGGSNIGFSPDRGGLGALSNAQAVAGVENAFARWTDLPESDAAFVNAGPLPADIDITNFGVILSAQAPNGRSEIVFDDDGAIFALLFGRGSGVLGFAGPDFGDPETCELLEGSAFLNGPRLNNAIVAEDVMVHEFGHYANLGHVELNGQVVRGFSEGDDDSGPSPDNTTFPAPPLFNLIETMYPIYFSPAVGTRTPHRDDIASLATLYPAADFAQTTGSITGTIRAPNGRPISGVNVIARNLDDPFADAVSTFSGAYTNNTDASDPNVGVYTLANLTPGAHYAVFVDLVTANPDRFNNPILNPLPGPEEYYNGADESADGSLDDPSVFEAVMAVAGTPTTGIDIVFNALQPGEPLAVGEDGSVELFLPFTFCIGGLAFDSVHVNANGNLTFGTADRTFVESAAGFLGGPPRVAALWDDLSPFNLFTGARQGRVTFDQTASTFTVSFEDVPEFVNTGANSFSITLRENSQACVADPSDDERHDRRDGDRRKDERRDDDRRKDERRDDDRGRGRDITIAYGTISARGGLAGVTAGLAVSNGIETEVDLTALSRGGRKKLKLRKSAALFEWFAELDGDLSDLTLHYDRVGRAFKDRFERNDSVDRAATIRTPFDTFDTRRAYSALHPTGDDSDFYQLDLEAGSLLEAEVVRGQIDSIMGLFFCPTLIDADREDSDSDAGRCDPADATLIAFNDDKVLGIDLLSILELRVPFTGRYALAISYFGDFEFDGGGGGQGPRFDGGRYVLRVRQDLPQTPPGEQSSTSGPASLASDSLE